MKQRETLADKAYRIWKAARLPEFFNKKGPKWTSARDVYLAHLEYTNHAPAWRRTANFMQDYHAKKRHWTSWQKAIAKWPAWVWHRLAKASVGTEHCALAAIDGTTLARSNPSQHYLHRIDRKETTNRPIQGVVMIDILRRKFLSWRIRAKPRGEKCDVMYLMKKTTNLPDIAIMDKGFDSEPLHQSLKKIGVFSIAPTRKGCRRGRHRKLLRECFDYTLYWQRNLVECLFSAIKRLYGVHIRARTWPAQRAEIYARLISYNIGAKRKLLSTEPNIKKKIMIERCLFPDVKAGYSLDKQE